MRTWTEAEIRALPVTIDIVTAGQILGIGRTHSYRLAQNGTFPVPVLHVGGRYKIPTAALRTYLGISEST